MKIYPNKANIIATKEINHNTDIPLSYINTSATDYDVNVVINENFKLKQTKEIFPYDVLSKNTLCLFDDKNNQIPYEDLIKNFKRDEDNYIYIPYGSQSFFPHRFKYDVIAKKNMKYSLNKIYNIKMLIANNPILANNFMPICGDAPSRLAAPSNVLINNGDLAISSITNNNIKDVDFAMITLKDQNTIIEYVNDKPQEVNLNIYNLMDINFINLIAVMKEDLAINDPDNSIVNENVTLKYSEDIEEYSLKNSTIYTDLKIETKYYFSIPANTETKRYHSIFLNKNKTPILIEEVIGKGFIIYISESFINQSINYFKLIYEILMKVYLMSYLIVKDQEDWISDVIPDYIINNNKLIKKDKFISNLEVHQMFNMNSEDINIYNVEINKEKYPFVEFAEMYNNYITFKKNTDGDNKKFSDPIKPKDAISIYTTKQNIIYFDKFIFSIDDDIEDCVSIQREDDLINVILKTFKHSSSGIYVKYPPEPIIINLIKVINNKEEQITNTDFYLICKENESASFFEIVTSESYDKDTHGDILLTIEVRQNSSKKVIYDMRKKGGGLPLDSKDDFNCFDIGHVYGRPYRKAGTLVITLPKRLEIYKDIIENTIKQYSVAEDYPVIFFKED